jgi:hypothetical protein
MRTQKPLFASTAMSLLLTLVACSANHVPVTETAYVNDPNVVVPDFSAIPFSLTQSVDDVGWKRWENRHVDANHENLTGVVTEQSTLPDYQNLVDIGKGAGTRLMTAWILQDFDTTNTICQQAKYNSDGAIMVPNASPLEAGLAQQFMDKMKANAAFVELGIHGISHEHYLSLTPAEAAGYDPALISSDPVWGLFLGTRAEFAHLQESTDPVAIQDPSVNDGYLAVAHPIWSWDNAQNHMTCWSELYRQYFPADQHGFPKSFVPPAHAYYFNQDDPAVTNQTTSDLLTQFGVKYVNGNRTVCFNSDQMIALDPNPMLKSVSYLHRVDGTNYDYVNEVPWYGTYNAFHYPFYPNHHEGHIEAHFCNMWDEHDASNAIITHTAVAKWTNYLLGVNDNPYRFLAKNTAQGNSQYYYHHNAAISRFNEGPYYILDTTTVPDEAYAGGIMGVLVLKTPLNGLHIAAAEIDKGAQVVAMWEDDFGYGYLAIGHATNPQGALAKDTYTLRATLGSAKMDGVVDLGKGTYNVFSVTPAGGAYKVALEMYGTQDVVFRVPTAPGGATSDNPALVVNSTSYNAATHEFTINVTTTDIQGSVATLTVQ